MKKNRLKEIIKEVLLEEKGYSKYIPGGKTDGLTQDTLEQILLNIANEEEIEEKYEGDPERGNKILDTADQENVDRILRGEEPEVDRMKELAGLKKEITVNKPEFVADKENFDKEWDLACNDNDDIEYAQEEVLEKYKGKYKTLDNYIEKKLQDERDFYQNF